jgi:sigma-E factor negative regulatory protein RseB
MSTAVGRLHFLAWLACAGFGAVVHAEPARARPSVTANADAQALLHRMNEALAQRNYIGTLRHDRNGRSETLRVIHRVRDGEVAERIVPLDGSRREFIRRGRELFCFLPDQGIVLVERRPRAGGMLNTLPKLDARSAEAYELQAVKRVRQQGRVAYLVSLVPRDGFRYGYRIWIDDRTAMPIKTELRDAGGQVIEETSFNELTLVADIPDSAFQPSVSTANLRWYRSAPVPVVAAARPPPSAWVASQLPPGFRLTQSSRQNLPGAEGEVEHLVFSDGFASVSVFIGSPAPPTARVPALGTGLAGASTTYVTRVEGRPLTVVGEVPLRTARFIAAQVRRAAPLDNPSVATPAPAPGAIADAVPAPRASR